MKNFIVSGIAALSLIGGVAFAQTYYPSNNPTPTYSSGGCVSITQTLSIGSRSSQVLALQQFLVSQNYPGGGAWMETGYFGQATAAAVRNFQQSQGLAQTGVVDINTQLAVDRVSCGNGSVTLPQPTFPTYPTYPTYPTNPVYPVNPINPIYPVNPMYPTYPNYSAPVITSLSQNTGVPGNVVTIYGQGFDQSNNIVYFGGTQLSGISSYNGTQLSFTIPYTSYSNSTNQVVQLYVTDSRGTSNSESFTLNPTTTNNCGTYSYGTNCGCTNTFAYTTGCNPCGYSYNSYPYNYGTGSNCPTNGTPTISYVNPQSGGVGASVTIYGSGFSTSGNSIRFGNGIITGLGSSDGHSLSFIVPSQLTGYGSQPLTLGTYQISVTNSNGVVSNQVPFTVTSTGATTGTPSITSVTGPSTLAVNTSGVWSVTLNNPNSNYTTASVTWGDTSNGYVNQAAPLVVNNGTQTVTFSHAYINPGTYTITFTVASQSGQSGTYSTTVVVSGNGTTYNGVPVISYLSPSSAYVGNQVTIYGSNFSTNSSSPIIVNFGNGAIQNAISNGSTIIFTVPSSVGPYCQSGYACAQYLQSITPGTYNVSVMDQYGTSNVVTFTVL